MRLNRGYCYRCVLGPDAANQTAVSFLARHFSHSTAAQWQERWAGGEILIDDQRPSELQPLRAGQVLTWNRPPWLEEETPQHYEVLYQDEHLLAVDKPSGLPTLPGAGFYLNTLLSLVQVEFPAACPLHRLGRATSGLVLFALNAEAASRLGKTWSQVAKQYQALASGLAEQNDYDIRSPIGKLAHPRLGEVHAASPTGKSARSVARTLERRADSTLFEVDLHTGRPHQIRIHLAFIGHPLVGDPLYAKGGEPLAENPGLPGDGGYALHAKRLKFEHPLSQQTIEIESPPPEILRHHQAQDEELSQGQRPEIS